MTDSSKAKYRARLPQLNGKLFLTDGGLETELVFLDGRDLPLFASFPVLETLKGRNRLKSYYKGYIRHALAARAGFVLETPTWRASYGWASQLGYSEEKLASTNERAVDLMLELRNEHETDTTPMVISGNLGPMGDGYDPSNQVTAGQAQDYHAQQIMTFAQTAADMVSAFTICQVNEAIGIVKAAQNADMPIAVSFTVETDGTLPTGQMLGEAIAEVDAACDGGPDYYMINCAHPDHVARAVADKEPWLARIAGLRSNASRMSHAELDECEELDDGNPGEFGLLTGELRRRMLGLTIVGGCCGTDQRHVGEAALACQAA